MRVLFFVFLVLFSSISPAKSEGFNAYAALGENLRPFSFRVGYDDWEGGMLNGFFGFDKVFQLSSGYYSAFGFAATTTFGVYGAVGFKTKLWIIPIRCELASIMDAKAQNQSGALVGVTYGF